jgi:peroxiredoxin
MAVDVNHAFPATLSFLADPDRRVTLAELRGADRAVALFFMRASNCPMCIRHAKHLAGLNLAGRGVRSVVVVPGGAKDVERVRRAVGTGVTIVSSIGTEAHQAIGLNRSMLMQHSGTLLVDAEGTVRYRLAAALPTGSFDPKALLAAIDTL